MSGLSLTARFPRASKSFLAANASLAPVAAAKPDAPPAPAKSALAVKFEAMWSAIGGPEYVTEYAFCEERRFRFDYAWPCRVALELQGGIHLAGKGGHVSPKGVRNDCDKLNLAVSMDWRVFKLATGQITFENLARIRDFIARQKEGGQP